jgi:O-methyltransferase involved in polyketide biosynthesis
MTARDFTTISPSAKSLLVTRSATELPYARAAADLLFGPAGAETARAELAKERASAFSALHFENRYRSIDEALSIVGATRILEIASGYSFRGLATAERDDVYYMDTELPDVVAVKQALVARLNPGPLAGELRLLPLDALDRGAFEAIVRAIPEGPFAIVQEGLLMYLDSTEKRRLAETIRGILVARSGHWICADIYVRSPVEERFARGERARAFLAAHHVDENKFENWASAETFFVESGFAIERRLVPSMGDIPRGKNQHARETWVVAAR